MHVNKWFVMTGLFSVFMLFLVISCIWESKKSFYPEDRKKFFRREARNYAILGVLAVGSRPAAQAVQQYWEENPMTGVQALYIIATVLLVASAGTLFWATTQSSGTISRKKGLLIGSALCTIGNLCILWARSLNP